MFIDLVFVVVFSILEEDREGAARGGGRGTRGYFFLRWFTLHTGLTVLWVGSGQQMRPARAQWLAGPPRGGGMRDAGALYVAKREKREYVKSRDSEHVVTTSTTTCA
jgi:hypothetical protein